MDAGERDAYVRAALALHGYVFDDAVIAQVVAQFERIEGVATILDKSDLPRDEGSAESFRP
jgi:Protein of unknown function (DUF4089)